eukprot:2365090-Rhodomonas_salina.1
MSGTEIAYAAAHSLRHVRVSCTKTGYNATHVVRNVRYWGSPVLRSGMTLRIHYGMSGTEIGYAATGSCRKQMGGSVAGQPA